MLSIGTLEDYITTDLLKNYPRFLKIFASATQAETEYEMNVANLLINNSSLAIALSKNKYRKMNNKILFLPLIF